MRFFSLIPAVLLAVTSFATAAPQAPAIASNITIDGSGDGPCQIAINIFYSVDEQVQTLEGVLSNVTSPVNPGQFILILTDLTNIITIANGQLEKYVSGIDLNPSQLANLELPAVIMLNALDSISGRLIPIAVGLLNVTTTDGTSADSNLLTSIRGLAACIQQFDATLTSGILPPTLDLVVSLLTAVGNLLNTTGATS